MLITVATATGQDVFALAERPLWQVLYTFYHLREQERRRMLARRLERVDAGVMTSFAFNEPKRLEDEMRSVQEAIAAVDRAPADDLAALRARGLALAAKLDAGRVLSPQALLPS